MIHLVVVVLACRADEGYADQVTRVGRGNAVCHPVPRRLESHVEGRGTTRPCLKHLGPRIDEKHGAVPPVELLERAVRGRAVVSDRSSDSFPKVCSTVPGEARVRIKVVVVVATHTRIPLLAGAC